jgi:hypothetical protein
LLGGKRPEFNFVSCGRRDGIYRIQSAAGGIDHDVAGITALARLSWSKQVTSWRFHIETVRYANVVVITATG